MNTLRYLQIINKREPEVIKEYLHGAGGRREVETDLHRSGHEDITVEQVHSTVKYSHSLLMRLPYSGGRREDR